MPRLRSESLLEGHRWKEDPRSGFIFKEEDFVRDAGLGLDIAYLYADEPHPSETPQQVLEGVRPIGSFFISSGGSSGASTNVGKAENDYSWAWPSILNPGMNFFPGGLDLGKGRGASITGLEMYFEFGPSGGALTISLLDGAGDVNPLLVSVTSQSFKDFALTKAISQGNSLYVKTGAATYDAENLMYARLLYLGS